jgi:hypothetical protein
MILQIKQAGLCDDFISYFDPDKCDVFHLPAVLDVIYGNNWYSILISDGSNAFFHVFSPKEIAGTGYYDIEPFLGYNGFIINNENPDRNFITAAIQMYKSYCYENNIIAEIIRFNPVLNNHEIFNTNELFFNIEPVKEIVVANCVREENLQLNEFGKSRKRDIKTALKLLDIEVDRSPFNYADFYSLYLRNLDRNKAKSEWYFTESFFSNASKSSVFFLFKVKDKYDRIHSTSIFILHTLCSYYFLAANNPPILPGANDLLIFEMCKFASLMNSGKLILGGGNSARTDDPLLLYKKKFSSNRHFLYLGKMVHNKDVFESFCSSSVMRCPELTLSKYFLKYRLG